METDELNIYSAGFEELWNKLSEVLEIETDDGLVKDIDEVKADLEKVKWGTRIRVPWYTFDNEKYTEEYPSSRKVKVIGYGKYNITEYMLERDKRMTIMRSIIKKYGDEQPITEARRLKGDDE